VKIKVQVDAKKERIGPAAAVKLARSVDKLWVAKGKKVVFFDLKQDKPSDAQLHKVLLGPSGNLASPHHSKRKRTYVGFHPKSSGEACEVAACPANERT